MTTTNFSYEYISQNPESREATIVKNLKDNLFWQNSLVEELIKNETFSYDDIHNLNDEEGEIKDVYMWYAMSENDLCTINALKDSSIPYIENNFGLWIGRTDFGSAWDMYFLPALAHVLYGD